MTRKVDPGASAKGEPESKKPADKPLARKASGAKTSAPKTRKPPAAKKASVAKKPVKKTSAKSAKKVAAPKAVVKKMSAKKAAAPKAVVKKTSAKKVAAPKAVVKKTSAKKSVAAAPEAKAPATRKPRRTLESRRAGVLRQLALMKAATDDVAIVEARNRRYYDAFQALDIKRLGTIWWRDDTVSCVHPGWDLRRGWAAVRTTYEEIFQGTRSIRFALGDVRVRVIGDVGYVTCVENLVSDEGDQGDYLGAVLATNVFERRRSEWRLVHHHASPFSVDEMTLPQGPIH